MLSAMASDDEVCVVGWRVVDGGSEGGKRAKAAGFSQSALAALPAPRAHLLCQP